MKYIILIIIVLFFIFFYRSPSPIIRKQNFDNVYAPSFGKIISIKQQQTHIFISIFLSPFDVHYQYYPVSGKITDFNYDATGKFALAYELNKSNENEKAITTITNSHGDFKIFQIAGMFVRRISTYRNISENVECGDKLGIIHFGSRVDILIPNKNFNLKVKEGEYVKGFNTLLGYYK